MFCLMQMFDLMQHMCLPYEGYGTHTVRYKQRCLLQYAVYTKFVYSAVLPPHTL